MPDAAVIRPSCCGDGAAPITLAPLPVRRQIMLLELLNTEHPTYDAETWRDYWALYEGGKGFRDRASRMLPRNGQEPEAVYHERLKVAHYRSYLGPIVDYFVAFLFTAQMACRANRDGVAVAADDWYGEWKEDADGAGTDLVEFLRERMTRTLVDGASWWIVELPADGGPAPMTRQEWAERGLGDARLRPINREQILDWSVGPDGALDWVLLYSQETPRQTPGAARDTILHRWWIYDRQNIELFEYRQKAGEPLDPKADVPSMGAAPHGFRRVPLVELKVPTGLWVANRVESPQREHFALSNAHTWAIRRTCYAMPVFNVKDAKKPPTMGTGYFLMIGIDESMQWSAPPATPFEMIRAEVSSQKDEIFRIVHQMALGVENNAAAVGRSAQSKTEDSNATKVILTAYGACVRKAVEQTYQLISEGRDDGFDWSIEGMDKYDTADTVGLVQAVTQADMLDIPSPTWAKEVRTRVALALLPDISQQLKDEIREEIETNFVAESVLDRGGVVEDDDESAAADATDNAGQGGVDGASDSDGNDMVDDDGDGGGD